MATDEFRPIFEGLRDAQLALVEANQALIKSGLGLQRTADAAVRAQEHQRSLSDEVADLRSHVTTLEGMVNQLLARGNRS